MIIEEIELKIRVIIRIIEAPDIDRILIIEILIVQDIIQEAISAIGEEVIEEMAIATERIIRDSSTITGHAVTFIDTAQTIVFTVGKTIRFVSIQVDIQMAVEIIGETDTLIRSNLGFGM